MRGSDGTVASRSWSALVTNALCVEHVSFALLDAKETVGRTGDVSAILGRGR